MDDRYKIMYENYIKLKVKEFENLINRNTCGLMFFINYHVKSPNYNTYKKYLNGEDDPNHYDFDPDQVIRIPFDSNKWCIENFISYDDFVRTHLINSLNNH